MNGATVPVADVTSRTAAELIAGMLRSHGLSAAVSAERNFHPRVLTIAPYVLVMERSRNDLGTLSP
jgi:hypothetical protein